MLGKTLARAAAILSGRMMKNKMLYAKIMVLRDKRHSTTLGAIYESATKPIALEFFSKCVKRMQTHCRSATRMLADAGGEKRGGEERRWE